VIPASSSRGEQPRRGDVRGRVGQLAVAREVRGRGLGERGRSERRGTAGLFFLGF